MSHLQLFFLKGFNSISNKGISTPINMGATAMGYVLQSYAQLSPAAPIPPLPLANVFALDGKFLWGEERQANKKFYQVA